MKFRHRLLLFGFLVAGLASLVVFLSAEALIRRSVTERVTERLRAETLALADILARDSVRLPDPGAPGGSPGSADAFADAAGTDLGLRVTIVAPDGGVLGDSSVETNALGAMENHALRPEIVEAREGGAGSSLRRSATVHDDLLYLARPVDRAGRIVGFVRLAIPVREIERTTGGYSLELSVLSFVALLGVALVGYLAARRFSLPIEVMSQAADEIASGKRESLIEYESSDEIGQLGAALNRMTRTLSTEIEALSAEKRLRDTMLEGMSEGLLVVDTQRHILLCNNTLRALLGLEGDDPSSRPLIEVVRDHAVIDAFDAALLRGESRRDVVRLEASRGGVLELTVVPLADPRGSLVGAVGLLFDITRLTALESVRREFVADVSHELRTPLASIKSFVETLLAGGIDDRENNRRFLEIIRRHSDRMEAILDDLTDLSRIETGAVSLDLESVELAPLVRDLLDSMRPKAIASDVSLAMDVPDGIRVTGDRRRMEQIVINLLENAIKFNKRGGSVTVRAPIGHEGEGPERAWTAGRVVRVEVEDTGIGIPAEALDRIFNRFYRVERSRSRQMGGTGLGLSIVKHLMRLHGGTVRVASRLGEGSRFILEFPRA